jgi:hypothetical protein
MQTRVPYSRSARLQRDREILSSMSANLKACKKALGKLSKDVREGLVETHIDMALNSIDYELTKNQVSMASLGASGLPQGDDGIT